MRYGIQYVDSSRDIDCEVCSCMWLEDAVKLAISYINGDGGQYYIWDDIDKKAYTIDEGIQKVLQMGGKIYDIDWGIRETVRWRR